MELKRLGSTTSWKAYTHQPMMVSSRLGPGEEMDGLDIEYLLENAAALDWVRVYWNLAGRARSKCVTDVGHEVQLPLGPSTRLCLETIRYERRHNVLSPPGPSTSDASANWELAGRCLPLGEGAPVRTLGRMRGGTR